MAQPRDLEEANMTSSSETGQVTRYDLKLWIDSLRESATYPPA
jgi:hypothetical protein